MPFGFRLAPRITVTRPMTPMMPQNRATFGNQVFPAKLTESDGALGGLNSCSDVVDRVKIPRIAPSLGGVESLIEQPMVMSYYECTPEERVRFGIFDNMIRLACGIENSADLIADLKQALG